eukprot:jgi/Psemu1/52664/gm1.52664_g
MASLRSFIMNTPDLASLFPSFDQALATFLHDSFDVPKESNSILCEALIASQYRTWSDFLFIEDIDDLTYQTGLKLQRFVDFGRHLTEQGLDWEECDHYTKEAFKEYWSGIAKAKRDSAADRIVANRGTPPDGSSRSTKPIDQLKYESWLRKSRDVNTFPVLHNDAQFEHWLVQVKAELDANGINTTTFLDPNWPATLLTGPKALHDKQCTFFWTLLRHVFQGDFSSSCVLYHQRTRNGRQAYFDFVHTPTSDCETDVHSTVDNPETPTGLPGSSNPGSTADSTSTGTSSYTWKYFSRTDSVRFSKVTSTPNIVPADIPTGDVPSSEPHSTRARTSYTSPAHSRWTFYPQSETVPDQQPASTLKDVKVAIAYGALEETNTRAVSLNEETKEPNQGGGSTGF